MRLLFARHNVRIFRFVLRMVGNEATAEDLVNEVFLEHIVADNVCPSASLVTPSLASRASTTGTPTSRKRSTR